MPSKSWLAGTNQRPDSRWKAQLQLLLTPPLTRTTINCTVLWNFIPFYELPHAHSLYGKSWSSLGRLLDPLTQDACAFYEDHSLFDDYTGVVLELEEGKRIAQTLGQNKAIILRNHGLLTVGHSVDEAAWWFITMERSCQAQLLAEAAGKPISIEPEVATLTHSQVGTHFMGWFSFQPLYEKIVLQEPDLLE